MLKETAGKIENGLKWPQFAIKKLLYIRLILVVNLQTEKKSTALYPRFAQKLKIYNLITYI